MQRGLDTNKRPCFSWSFFANRFAMDSDVVVFVNDEEAPFHDVLKDFHDVLLCHTPLKRDEIKVTAYSVQFLLHGVDFDLLAATNLATAGKGVCFFNQPFYFRVRR